MDREEDRIVQIETNLDDFNPEGMDLLFDRLFQAGALDVFATPIQMKKSRPGLLLTVLAPPEKAEAAREVLFEETPTLGVRTSVRDRVKLPRSTQAVETPFGPVRIVWAELGGGRRKWSPEYEDVKQAALRHRVPMPQVQEAVARAVSTR